MIKWEYAVVDLTWRSREDGGRCDIDDEQVVKRLDAQGYDGWELVQIVDGCGVFKRQRTT